MTNPLERRRELKGKHQRTVAGQHLLRAVADPAMVERVAFAIYRGAAIGDGSDPADTEEAAIEEWAEMMAVEVSAEKPITPGVSRLFYDRQLIFHCAQSVVDLLASYALGEEG